ncbi:MAG: hypothetical protein ABFD25_18360 [Clostridiaceae bacterium]
MNMEQIREQMEGIQIREPIATQDILNKIRARRQKRKARLRVMTVAASLLIVIGAAQFQQISTFAQSVYRSIILSLNKDILDIGYLETIPAEIKGLSWVGGEVGSKHYSGIADVEEELGIRVLRNTLSIDMERHRNINLTFFKTGNVAKLNFHRHFIGDLKNYQETILDNGDLKYSYESDGNTLYKSPVSMTISFVTGGGADVEKGPWEFFDYEEKYLSPENNITAYLMKPSGSIIMGGKKIALREAAGEPGIIAVFVWDNLLYTLSGNIPSSEMKRIVDAFIVSD